MDEKLPRIRFVSDLPDLITAEDEPDSSGRTKVRVRITCTDDGIEIIGDCMYESVLEELLIKMGAEEMERMLCG